MLMRSYEIRVANKIKIAYILTPITFGGSEKVSLNFLRTVDRENFEIHPILFTRPWEDEPHFARELHRLSFPFDTIPVALNPGSDPWRVLRVSYRLHSLLRKGSYKVVHTHGYFADICGLPVARILGIDTVSTCHGFISNDRKLITYNLLDKYVLRMCKTVIAVSENLKNELISSGIEASRIKVLPNAVTSLYAKDELDVRRMGKRRSLDIGPNQFIVGYLGRLSQEKGLIYLVEAISILRNSGVPVKLLVVGDGPERAGLEKIVKDRELDPIVHFAGFQADAENWLPAFDILVLPSLTEGTPMALLEAMAAGIPVIATAVGGVPKVVADGVNGLLVEPGSSCAISEKIQLLWANSDLSMGLGRAGFRTIQNEYNIDKWCRTITNLYY